MHCDDAARALYSSEAGGMLPDLEVHLSACDECRHLAEDVTEMNRAFASARAEWTPSPAFRVDLPVAPWKRLAIAASLLVIPLAGWAVASIPSARPSYDVAAVLEPRAADQPSDRELLGALFLEESRP
jgi:predicted anti-sigma-YlaC factor YlaD